VEQQVERQVAQLEELLMGQILEIKLEVLVNILVFLV
jgi:hypothetical protein